VLREKGAAKPRPYKTSVSSRSQECERRDSVRSLESHFHTPSPNSQNTNPPEAAFWAARRCESCFE